jgi:NADPH:quinone reductase-like Zn-dependent oxidoreductase
VQNTADLSLTEGLHWCSANAWPSLPFVALTAWQVLVERAKLKKGRKVLIHAGSGGVGTMAIQLAKHIGATVATTTSTANVDLVRSLGADVVVDYKKADFENVLQGYDVVLNSLGKDTLEKSLRVLKPAGGSSQSPVRQIRSLPGRTVSAGCFNRSCAR